MMIIAPHDRTVEAISVPIEVEETASLNAFPAVETEGSEEAFSQ